MFQARFQEFRLIIYRKPSISLLNHLCPWYLLEVQLPEHLLSVFAAQSALLDQFLSTQMFRLCHVHPLCDVFLCVYAESKSVLFSSGEIVVTSSRVSFSK